jgi:hypothetical protein
MFIQIKDIAINVNHIETVRLNDNHVKVYVDVYTDVTGEQRCYDFTGDEAEAFRRWWEEKAGVYVAL